MSEIPLHLRASYSAQILNDARMASVGEFVGQQVKSCPPIDAGKKDAQLVLDCITQDLDTSRRTDLIGAFDNHATLQMADGAHLFTDSEVLLNNLLAREGLLRNGIGILATQQCSTISCITQTSTRRGPAFVNWRGETIPLFENSHNSLKHSSPSTIRDVTVSDAIAALPFPGIEDFVGKQFHTGFEAICQLNRAIWPDSGTVPLIFGEELSCDAVAAALEKTDLADIICSSENVQDLLASKRLAISHPDNLMLRDSTDLFYQVRKSRLVPLRLRGSRFIDKCSGEPTGLRLNQDDIIDLLKDRRIFPDITLSYAVLCLRSGIAALGGLSQQEYLPRIAEMWGYSEAYGRACSKLIGGIIEITDEITVDGQAALVDSASQIKFAQDVTAMSIEDAVHEWSNFDYYKTLQIRKSASM